MSEVTSIDNEAAAIKPNTEETKFYAILAWKGLSVKPAGKGEKNAPVVLRYLCAEAKPIGILKHVKTFIYFCPVSDTWDVHEVKCGARIAGGLTISHAVKKTLEFFKEASEEMFFKQCTMLGPVEKNTLIEFDTAMKYLKAGEEEYQRAATLRRMMEQKAPKAP